MPNITPNTVSILRRTVVWPALVTLAALGVVIAVVRVWAIGEDASGFDAISGVLPPVVVQEGRQVEVWYARHAVSTLAHVVPGLVLVVLIPLQFAGVLRRRWPRFHRIVGRTIIVIAIPTALTGLTLGAMSPYSGLVADAAIALFGTLFLVAITRAYRAARRRDFVHHREWMIRMTSVALGVATVRIVGLPLHWLTGASPLNLAGPAFWIGLATTYTAAELWIHITRA